MTEVVVQLYAVGFIYIPGKLVLCFVSLCSLMICVNNRVHYCPMVVFVSLHIILPDYHHYANVSESVCHSSSQFSQSTLL